MSWIPPTTRHVPWVFQIGVFLFQTKRVPRTLQRVMGNLFRIPITPTAKKNIYSLVTTESCVFVIFFVEGKCWSFFFRTCLFSFGNLRPQQKIGGKMIFPNIHLQVQCNEALSICGEVQAQFAYAPLATNYELFWDAGTGSLPDILVYTGSLPSADIAISSQTCYQFRVRGTTSDGMSDFGEIRSVSLSMLAAPSGLKIQEIRGGAVTLSWDEIISSCVGWYEVEIFNVAFGYTWILKSGLPEIRVDDLDTLDLYNFSVRLCDIATCTPFSSMVSVVPSEQPLGPTTPYALQYENGLVTITWSSFETNVSEIPEPFIQEFQIFTANLQEGPYFYLTSISSNQEPLATFACNETIFIQVVAIVSSTWSSAITTATSPPGHVVCAALPVAPPAPTATVRRVAYQRDEPSLFEVTVELTLMNQVAEILQLHSGFELELVRKNDNQILEQVGRVGGCLFCWEIFWGEKSGIFFGGKDGDGVLNVGWLNLF